MEREPMVVPIPSTLNYVTQVKLTLMRGITAHIRARFTTMVDAAEALDIPEETLSRIACNRIERFSIAWLLMTIERLGARITIQID